MIRTIMFGLLLALVAVGIVALEVALGEPEAVWQCKLIGVCK